LPVSHFYDIEQPMRKQKEISIQLLPIPPTLQDEEEDDIGNQDTQDNERTQLDKFVCNIIAPSIKDDIGGMEHPMFAISSKPDTKIRRYQRNGIFVEIAPSAYGLATIFDKDVLLYCISQLIAGINRGRKPSRTVRVTAHDLLTATYRGTGGRSYQLLEIALDRLAGTRIKTNLRTGGRRIKKGFGIIDTYQVIEKSPNDDQMVALEITLSQWMYNAVLSKETLTLNPEYFQISGGLERRIYEIARKHCGNQPIWKIRLQVLHEKSGSQASLKEFRRMLQVIVEENNLFDYQIYYNREEDLVEFLNRNEDIHLQASIKKLLT